jgi:hypothetical protein
MAVDNQHMISSMTAVTTRDADCTDETAGRGCDDRRDRPLGAAMIRVHGRKGDAMIRGRRCLGLLLIVAALSGLAGPGARAQQGETRLYFERNGELAAVTRPLGGDPAAAVTALLAGPTEIEQGFGVTTALPPLTALVGLAIDGNRATVTLSGAFLAPGADDAVTTRFAQLVYTLTQFPGIAAVTVNVDTSAGAPREPNPAVTARLGNALARGDLDGALGRVLVESPGIGSGAGDSIAVSGLAKVLDGIFAIVVRDRDGVTLGRQTVTFAWTGRYEPFSATVALATPPSTPQYLFVTIVDALASASGRSTQQIAVIPLWYAA